VRTLRRPAAPTVLNARILLLVAGGMLSGALSGCDAAEPPGAALRTVPGGSPERGLALIAQYQCGSCHTIPRAPGTGMRIGPPLEGFGDRSYIAGRVPNGPHTLQRWLQEPQALVPGTTMPDLGVSAHDARHIAAYLLQL
jgi:cytochrome c